VPPGSERNARGRARDPSAQGRRAATVLYWLLVVFVITAGIRSVVGQVFFPPPAAPPAATCDEGVQRLRAELGDHALAARVAAPPDAAPTDWRAWDRAYGALQDACAGPERARYVALGRMRYALEGVVARYDREVAPLDERVSATAEPSTPPSP